MANIGTGFGSSGFPPRSFQKAMVFIDGTNLLYRLQSKKLKVPLFKALFTPHLGGRQISRAYLYTVQQHLDEAQETHGADCCSGVRVILGEGVKRKDGNIKEKGVDALLVADMIYHAATRNYEYALVITADTDFVYVLRRVEDFGCRTAVLSICCEAPARLVAACDDYYHEDAEHLIKRKVAVQMP